jgi:hypothetical protein
MKQSIFSFVSLVVLSIASVSAHAVNEPCYQYRTAADYAQRNLQSAQSNLSRAENNFYRAQNQVALRITQLESTVAQRQAFAESVNTSAGAFTSACVVRGVFFRFGWRNCANAAAMGATRRARARASVDAAQANLRSYTVYSAGYLRRMATMVETAQTQVNTAQANLQTAVNAYQECLSTAS